MIPDLPRAASVALAGLSGLFIVAYVLPDILMHHLGLWTMTRGCKAGICALTFDDGPDPCFTPLILDALKLHHCQATFFVVGKKAVANPEVMDRMAREGHEVALHGWDHRHPWLMDPLTCVSQLKRASDETLRYRRAGSKPKYRPCWGFWSLWVVAASSGYRRVTWSVAGHDWKRGASPGTVEAAVTSRVRDGDIILLHDGARYSSVTVQALPAILEGLEAKGLRQVTVDELER